MATEHDVGLVRADSDALWGQARQLISAYAASLDVSLDYQGIAHELEHLESEYGPPDGALLLAVDGERCVGCGAIRRLSAQSCEMKRLFVLPAGQGRGVGTALVKGLIAEGRRTGYQQMLLDTLLSMQRAQALYRGLGFRDVEPYRFSPIPGTVYMRLKL